MFVNISHWQGNILMSLRTVLTYGSDFRYYLFFHLSAYSNDCRVLDTISDTIEKALSLHTSAHIFAFGDFTVHRVRCLNHSNATDPAGNQTLDFSLTQSLTQIVDFPTRVSSNSDGHTSLIDLFLTSTPDLCRTLQLFPLCNSGHASVSIDISFRSHISLVTEHLSEPRRTDWD